jgi:hypothetical protein
VIETDILNDGWLLVDWLFDGSYTTRDVWRLRTNKTIVEKPINQLVFMRWDSFFFYAWLICDQEPEPLCGLQLSTSSKNDDEIGYNGIYI